MNGRFPFLTQPLREWDASLKSCVANFLPVGCRLASSPVSGWISFADRLLWPFGSRGIYATEKAATGYGVHFGFLAEEGTYCPDVLSFQQAASGHNAQ